MDVEDRTNARPVSNLIGGVCTPDKEFKIQRIWALHLWRVTPTDFVASREQMEVERAIDSSGISAVSILDSFNVPRIVR